MLAKTRPDLESMRLLACVNGSRNPLLNGGGCFPGTIFEQRSSKMSRSGVKGKRSLAKRILDAAKGQKTGPGCDLGRAHKSAFSPPSNGGFASPLTPGNDPCKLGFQCAYAGACHLRARLVVFELTHCGRMQDAIDVQKDRFRNFSYSIVR